MRSWWDRTLEYLADYIAVYGWADPTSSMPPTWIDDPDRNRGDADVDAEPKGESGSLSDLRS